MSTAWMLSLVLAAAPVVAPLPQMSADQLRAAYADAMTKSARRAHPDAYRVVPPLVSLYGQLGTDQALSHAERSRMRRGVENRLEELRDRTLREALANHRRRQRAIDRASQTHRPTRGAQLAAPGEAVRAVELIELIQNAIAPESWQANGGRGTISYFPLLKVLVIRQRGEVHHQIGNGLSELKR